MTSSPACASCSKTAPEVKLKHCVRCPEIKYCGRVCQTAHWPIHRATCNSQTGARSASRPSASTPQQSSSSSAKLSPPKGLQQGIAQPFTRLDKGTWLHDRPRQDVFALLLDAYRLRIEDMYNHEGEAEADSLYGGAPNGLVGFRRFLGRVTAARPALLPPWWDETAKKECEDLGMQAGGWHSLAAAVEKCDIVEHYGDGQFPMQLRMFAEAVYGSAPGGASGAAMKGMMMAMEQGGGDGFTAANLDISKMFARR
ncbi:Zinc finger, MYND-type [Cordyceps fumosorosea ARSEF 2679]|uniref:Zinc finger, MYND-type n=1 Tax=Cordyceps fumosorosea (strain ARSEF 2679) TaxID=1081104 RepID=A0A167XDQ2_CORFA|nr:Zinc finger, MYND-type [Cordyceps fumosorosea ARSEF 2679]OAA64851.1 Zinc finger, MYND-type [Cordyceps fumosorosea ARSEF 2679]